MSMKQHAVILSYYHFTIFLYFFIYKNKFKLIIGAELFLYENNFIWQSFVEQLLSFSCISSSQQVNYDVNYKILQPTHNDTIHNLINEFRHRVIPCRKFHIRRVSLIALLFHLKCLNVKRKVYSKFKNEHFLELEKFL